MIVEKYRVAAEPAISVEVAAYRIAAEALSPTWSRHSDAKLASVHLTTDNGSSR